MTHLRSSLTLSSALVLALAALGVAACASDDGSNDIQSKPKSLFGKSNTVWPGGVVPVCWESMPPEQATERAWVQAAADRTWGSVSGVIFQWSAEPCAPPEVIRESMQTGPIRIRVADEHPRVLALGSNLSNYPGGMILNFTFATAEGFTSCSFAGARQGCIESIAVHELGHAIGFAHEQNRSDTPATCKDAPNGSDGDSYLTPWDERSVMNYCNLRWNNGGELSPFDQMGARQFYGATRDLTFDPVFYMRSNPDVAAVYGANNWGGAIEHFNASGLREGRRGAPYFDAAYYLSRYPDLQAAFGNDYAAAARHFVDNGIREGRASSTGFDVAYYLRANPDLAAAFGGDLVRAFEHFRSNGVYEGRPLSPQFHPAQYLAMYEDLRAAYGAQNYAAAFEHYVRNGASEGRRGTF